MAFRKRSAQRNRAPAAPDRDRSRRAARSIGSAAYGSSGATRGASDGRCLTRCGGSRAVILLPPDPLGRQRNGSTDRSTSGTTLTGLIHNGCTARLPKVGHGTLPRVGLLHILSTTTFIASHEALRSFWMGQQLALHSEPSNHLGTEK
jgi:hypothetical protein